MSNFVSRLRGAPLALLATASVASAQVTVPWSSKTLPIPSTGVGDVAVFPNPVAPRQSRIIGTDSIQNGLFSFTFDGGTAQCLSLGPMRGVDVKTGLRFAFAPSAVLVASSVNAGVFVYGLDDGGTLYELSSRFVTVGGSGALALWAVPDGGLEGFFDVGSATLKRLAFFDDPLDAGRLDWVQVDAGVTFPRSVTGLVVDAKNRRLYASIAADGIYEWRIDQSDAGNPVLVEGLAANDAGGLTAPAEGLSLYPLRDGGTLLLAAQPSRDQYSVYRVNQSTLTLVGTFQLAIDTTFVRNGAFLDVSRAPVPEYPLGVVAFSNRDPTNGATYQLVGWDVLANSFVPPLPIEDGGPSSPDAGFDAGVVLGTCPDVDGGSDAGASDGGADGGLPCVRRDAGIVSDSGVGSDGGSMTGSGGGVGGGTGGGIGGGAGGGGGGDGPNGCGCTSSGAWGAVLPLVALLFARRRRPGRSPEPHT